MVFPPYSTIDLTIWADAKTEFEIKIMTKYRSLIFIMKWYVERIFTMVWVILVFCVLPCYIVKMIHKAVHHAVSKVIKID